MITITYLRRDEWSMGNGQCPECHGLAPDARWDGHVCLRLSDWSAGHRAHCQLAAALQELGVQPVMAQKKEWGS